MKVKTFEIEGVFLIEPSVFGDARGYFMESFNQEKFETLTGIKTNFVQDNESKSTYGVLRGLHYQKPPFAQAKIVRVVEGKVLDVIVDIRSQSPTFGQHLAVELSEDNKHQLFVPRGFAHGFVVLSESAVFSYKVDNYYHKESDAGIIYNDEAFNIDWKIAAENVLLSEKDAIQQTFEQYRVLPVF